MVNVRSILENLGYTNITENGKELRMAPIYRESSNNTVLRVYKDSGKWVDFAANISGNLDDLIKLTLKLPSIEDVNLWKQNKNIQLVTYEDDRSKLFTPRIYNKNILNKLVKEYGYWNNRSISTKVLKLFRGGVAYGGKMSGRYVFPIFNKKNEILGFVGRYIKEDTGRIKWKILGRKEMWVYPAFLNAELLKTMKQVILVEGISDLLALYESGVYNVLSLFGINIQKGILNFLIRFDMRKIIISTNNDIDNIGNNAAQLIKKKLSVFFDENNISIVLPKRKDFGEILVNDGKEEVQKYFI